MKYIYTPPIEQSDWSELTSHGWYKYTCMQECLYMTIIIIILILQLSVCDVRAGGHRKRFDPK